MLVTVGDLLLDTVIWPRAAVRHGTDNAATVYRSRGGSAANVAAFAAGRVATRFIGCIGTDRVGDALIADLAATGTDVRVQRRGRTGSIVVLVDGDGERTMFPDRAAAADLQPIPESWLASAGCLHVPSYCFAAEPTAATTMALIRTAGRLGIPVSLDTSSTGMILDYGLDRFRQLLDAIGPDVLFANAAEARLLELANDRYSGALTVIKDGGRPTRVQTVFGPEFSVEVPPVVGVRDSTGAGDAFAAGFLAEWLRGREVVDCVEAGHARARGVLRAPGATTEGAPVLGEERKPSL